ncbi:uncharacterized protein BT62DRAFT_1079414 [Guyanagaster necrorhizus]|uniref:F-box protein n=1 Tax=Guyanagaster necrorhizus TaxID=856835 RepID=A0A9P7VKS1_9AGAR|nr:uncharacterized protein BT62DRAFT_1079414 [Guyanagaster necrorhizus MCA 3950]KAG7442302.1 hypothetical protein BT62DRAFT_1079414 [Guyanagaster necrorhizus MCA 3950]
MANSLFNCLPGHPLHLFSTLSTNYGLAYTCEDFYTCLVSAGSLQNLITPGHRLDCIIIERRGPPYSPSDPFLPTLLAALAEHKDIKTLKVVGVRWSDFPYPDLWYASVTEFHNITYLNLTETSLRADEFCCLVRSFPLLQMLDVQCCSIFPGLGMTNQLGPAILYLVLNVKEDSDILDIFTHRYNVCSPVSFDRLYKLEISGKGGRDIGQQISRLVDASWPRELIIDCMDFDLAHAPRIVGLSKTEKLTITIPLNAENGFRRTNDCLRWWTSTLERVPQRNKFAEIRIKIVVDQPSVTHYLSGGIPMPWTHFDEALSDKKFKLKGSFGITFLRQQDTSSTFEIQPYDYWMRLYALAKSFKHHLGSGHQRHM